MSHHLDLESTTYQSHKVQLGDGCTGLEFANETTEWGVVRSASALVCILLSNVNKLQNNVDP
jgi:hypothetical protein